MPSCRSFAGASANGHRSNLNGSNLNRVRVAGSSIGFWPLVWSWFLGCFAGCCLIGRVSDGHAQGPAVQNEKPKRVSVSYFGDGVVRPGARVAYEGTLYSSGPHKLLMAASIGGHQTLPGYALFLAIGGGYRLALASGLFLDVQAAIGYKAVNKPGSVESLPDGGSVQMPPSVSNYFMPIGLAGVGFDLMPRLAVPVSVFVHGGGYGLTGNGEPFSGGYVLDAGLAYQFGTGRPSTVPLPVASPPPAEAPPDLDQQPSPSPVLSPAPAQPPAQPTKPQVPSELRPPSLFPPESAGNPAGSGPPQETTPTVPPLPPPPTANHNP